MAMTGFSHTVQLTANWHGCSLLLLLLLLPLSGLQPSPPTPKLHNTTSRCRKHRRLCIMIWINSLKKRRGAGKHWANRRPLCIRICNRGESGSVQWGEKIQKICCHIHDAYQRERRAGFAQPIEPDGISLQKANTKRDHNQQLAFWRDSRGWSKGTTRPIQITSIHSYTINSPIFFWGFTACYTHLVWTIYHW